MLSNYNTASKHQQPRLLTQVSEALRTRHYSIRTEEAYVQWIRRFILCHDKRHPVQTGAHEVQQFLTDLALRHRIAAATQNQALSAILFLYKVVLQQDIGWIEDVVRAKKPKKLPVVLSCEEVKAMLHHASGPTWLMMSLLYGAGLRLMECLRLRVKEMDFASQHITVRQEKGGHDRVTMLPGSLDTPLQQHLAVVKRLHAHDLEEGYSGVPLPDALARKYPHASRDWVWQYVFPAARRIRDRQTGVERVIILLPWCGNAPLRQLCGAPGFARLRAVIRCGTLRHNATPHGYKLI